MTGQVDLHTESLLRFVFDDAVVSLPLSGVVTLEDVARIRGRVARGRHGRPIAVSITFASPACHAVGQGAASQH